MKKNEVRPGVRSEEKAIFDKVVSSEERSLEPFKWGKSILGGGSAFAKAQR